MGADGDEVTLEIRERPDRCPRCHVAVDPIQVAAHAETDRWLQIVYRCPRRGCQELFIAYYHNRYDNWYLDRVETVRSEAPLLPDAVKDVSPDFVAIYAEARDSEQRGQRRIAGVGYRKALEFLVKDYLIKKRPDDADAIKKAFLGPCIRDYVDDERIKIVAERATWLGNDETHYVRLWEGKDIADLNRLIDLTVHWIAMNVATDEVLAEMPEGKKP